MNRNPGGAFPHSGVRRSSAISVGTTMKDPSGSQIDPDLNRISPINGHPKSQTPQHTRNKQTLKTENIHTPWLDLVPEREYTSVLQRLHHEIVAYTTYMQPSVQEVGARRAVISAIERTIQRRFPGNELKVFGSSATNLYLPSGDIDLAIVNGEIPEKPKAKKSALFHMSAVLKMARITSDVQVNHRARVPIISFTTNPEYGSFDVDIGINNVDGIKGADVLNGYLASMPALRPLVLVLKGFLSRRDLNNAGKCGLGSYALICMCISFLQLNPHNQPLGLLEKPLETESLGVLLLDFFLYYGVEFPYTTMYISINTRQLVPKQSASWINNTIPDRLAIQCLIQPENDAGKATSQIGTIRHSFLEGHAHFTKLIPADTNILKPLLSVNKKIINHRAHIHRIVDSGQLQPVNALTSLPRFPPISKSGERLPSKRSRSSDASTRTDWIGQPGPPRSLKKPRTPTTPSQDGQAPTGTTSALRPLTHQSARRVTQGSSWESQSLMGVTGSDRASKGRSGSPAAGRPGKPLHDQTGRGGPTAKGAYWGKSPPYSPRIRTPETLRDSDRSMRSRGDYRAAVPQRSDKVLSDNVGHTESVASPNIRNSGPGGLRRGYSLPVDRAP